MAEREGIEPTKPELGFNGFENRGDHQAHSTLREECDRHHWSRQMNESIPVKFYATELRRLLKAAKHIVCGRSGSKRLL